MATGGASERQGGSAVDGERCDVIRTADALAERLAEIMGPSSAIVCIGSDLRGDDGVGTAVAERLAGRVPWCVYNTQTAPESYLMKIVEAGPQSVVVIDAADLGAAPGEMKLVDAAEVAGQGVSTHGPSPAIFIALLRRMLPACPCAVLGVQPLDTAPGEPLSAPARQAVDTIVRAFELLARRPGRA